jgi:hypothetical protein
MAKCSHKECVLSSDCGILEITQKIPKNTASCSYFKSQAAVDKKKRKKAKQEADLAAFEAAKKKR